jgi:hypothetical protein
MTSSPESTDVLGCDLRGGDVADRFNCFAQLTKPKSVSSLPSKENFMKDTFAGFCRYAVAASMLAWVPVTAAQAQVPLSSYTDANGFIDVRALTCAQLANTFQEDADMLAAWYSGWYNGLAKKHFAHFTRAKAGEHQLILYCKAHPQMKIIEAVDVLLKNEKKP